jgi:serine protease Do
MKSRSLIAVALTIGVAAGSFLVGSWIQGQNPAAAPREPISFREVARKVLPAVVSIETRTRKAKANLPADAPLPFPQGPKDDFGSGFLVTASGVVVTSFHIVQDAERVLVKLHDGRKFSSREVRGDVRSDLAVILLDTRGAALPFLEFGDSDAMEIGDPVLAVGAPFGLVGSVTHGIVSGKGRDLNLNLYEDFLQTDAAINPGNSGGPLVNMAGQAVGVCAAIKSRSGGFQGVGLAVASNLARGVVESLRKEGMVRRAYLGLQARDLDRRLAPRLGVPNDAGVVIAQVFADTAAAKAQLEAGDLLTRIDGIPVASTKALQIAVARLPVGKAVALEYVRDGKTHTAQAPIGEQPASYTPAVATPRLGPLNVPAVMVPSVAVSLADLTPGLTKDLGYPPAVRGVLVTRVHSGGLAAEAGIAAGMLITRVEGKPAATAAAAREMLEASGLDRGVVVQVQSLEGGVTYVLLGGPEP